MGFFMHVEAMESISASPFTVTPAAFGGYQSLNQIRRFLPNTCRNDHIKEGYRLLLKKQPLSLDRDQT
jgi:hypothetical protein